MSLEFPNEQDYHKFVDYVTSDSSKNLSSLVENLQNLENTTDINLARLLTGAIGLGSESGELEEIVKKVAFQGKPLDNDTVYHLKREMSDCMWYISQLCIALDTSFSEIVNMNIEKLSKRYPGGFEVARSENREKDDI